MSTSETRITVFARIKAKQGMADQVKERLLALIPPTREEDGCIIYELHQSADDETLFMFYENWASRAALEAHLKQPHLEETVRATSDLLAEPPLIQVFDRIG